jgi:predicted SPOUT superfamily RNA methylase MTH1
VKSNGESLPVVMPAAVEQTERKEVGKPTPTLSFYQRVNPHKPSALASLHGSAPRRYTVSVALPGSIILNAQSPELQARLVGQLARSCAIFNIDEIVVFNDGDQSQPTFNPGRLNHTPLEASGDDQGDNGPFDPNAFLARILQYVETPQYLRKSLFPMHRDLRMAGILAPLDCPHHLRFEEQSPYREGVCVEAPHWATDHRSTWVFTGFRDPIECKVKGQGQGASSVPVGARVTVKMPEAGKKGESCNHDAGYMQLTPNGSPSRLYCQSSRTNPRNGAILGIHDSSLQLTVGSNQSSLLE